MIRVIHRNLADVFDEEMESGRVTFNPDLYYEVRNTDLLSNRILFMI